MPAQQITPTHPQRPLALPIASHTPQPRTLTRIQIPSRNRRNHAIPKPDALPAPARNPSFLNTPAPAPIMLVMLMIMLSRATPLHRLAIIAAPLSITRSRRNRHIPREPIRHGVRPTAAARHVRRRHRRQHRQKEDDSPCIHAADHPPLSNPSIRTIPALRASCPSVSGRACLNR